MIVFVYGTTAELIKLAPIYRGLDEMGARPLLWCTSQQAEELPHAHDVLGIPPPDVQLADGAGGRSLRTTRDVVRWLGKLGWSSIRRFRNLRAETRRDGAPACVVVHGDTMTTVLGALLGRLIGATVVHVEAGLRSFDWKHPFPEELDRRITARIAQIHFAPGSQEVENLRGVSGSVVCTHGNTVVDSLKMVPASSAELSRPFAADFGLVSLHRTELLQNEERLERTLSVLEASTTKSPLVMVQDPVTEQRIRTLSLDNVFGATFVKMSKLDYFSFVGLLRSASFVVTDSGGLQEECAALGKPCLVHRARTERGDGLGENAVLSGFDETELAAFLADPSRYCRSPFDRSRSPSARIVDELTRRGFVLRAIDDSVV